MIVENQLSLCTALDIGESDIRELEAAIDYMKSFIEANVSNASSETSSSSQSPAGSVNRKISSSPSSVAHIVIFRSRTASHVESEKSQISVLDDSRVEPSNVESNQSQYLRDVETISGDELANELLFNQSIDDQRTIAYAAEVNDAAVARREKRNAEIELTRAADLKIRDITVKDENTKVLEAINRELDWKTEERLVGEEAKPFELPAVSEIAGVAVKMILDKEVRVKAFRMITGTHNAYSNHQRLLLYIHQVLIYILHQQTNSNPNDPKRTIKLSKTLNHPTKSIAMSKSHRCLELGQSEPSFGTAREHGDTAD